MFEDDGVANVIKEHRELSRAEYRDYKAATKTLLEWNTVQDRYSVITSHYLRYRTVVQNAEADLAAGRRLDLPVLRREVNEHVSGFLAAFRSFLDQSDAYLARTYGRDSAERADFTRTTNHLYDTNFSYRLMDQLRNFTQHAGQAIDNVSYSETLDPNTGARLPMLRIAIKRDTLLSFSRLKASIRREIEGGPENLPMTVYMGAHVNSARRLHVEFTRRCAVNLRNAAESIVKLVEPTRSLRGIPAVIDFAFAEGNFDPHKSVEIKLDWPPSDFAEQVLRLLDRLPPET